MSPKRKQPETTTLAEADSDDGDVVLLEEAVDGEHHAAVVLGRLDLVWSYEMRVRRQEGQWVVDRLCVFADAGSVFERARGSRSFSLGTGGDYSQPVNRPAQPAAEARNGYRSLPAGGLTPEVVRRVRFRTNPAIKYLKRLDWACTSIAKGRKLQRLSAAKIKAAEALLVRERDKRLRLLRVAEHYVDAIKRRSRNPNGDVARELRLTKTQVTALVNRCRKADLMTRTRGSGHRGGELTELAVQWRVLVAAIDAKLAELSLERSSGGAPKG